MVTANFSSHAEGVLPVSQRQGVREVKGVVDILLIEIGGGTAKFGVDVKRSQNGIWVFVASLNLLMPTEAKEAVGSAIFEKVMRL